MSEHTRRPPTEAGGTCTIRVVGPSHSYYEAMETLKQLGYVNAGECTPWRELFDDEELTAGNALKGARYKEGLTQKELAQKAGIPQGHISGMENDKMGIGKERAHRLANVLNIDYRILL